MIIYLHGFNSSPGSHKARLLQAWFERHGSPEALAVPVLHHRPALAAQAIEREITAHDPAEVTLVGSSLGGFYATWAAEKFGVRAVLVNPAVNPQRSLSSYIGPQQNLYTGERYELTAQHIEELEQLAVDTVARPELYLLLVQTGDEVLDYREAVAKYRGARQRVIEGGDHGFQRFEDYIPEIMAFAGFTPA